MKNNFFLDFGDFQMVPVKSENGEPAGEIRVWSFGLQERKRTIVFIPGGRTVIEASTPLLKKFAELGYSLLCFDYRGQGFSSRQVSEPTVLHVENENSFVEDSLATINLVPKENDIYILGVSFGGTVALRLINRCSQKIKKLILVAPFLKPSSHIPTFVHFKKNMANFMYHLFPKHIAIPKNLTVAKTSSNEKVVVSRIFDPKIELANCSLLTTDYNAAVAFSELNYQYAKEGHYATVPTYSYIHAVLQSIEHLPLPSEVNVPTHIFLGSDDILSSRKAILRYASESDFISMEFLDNARHLIQLEKADILEVVVSHASLFFRQEDNKKPLFA